MRVHGRGEHLLARAARSHDRLLLFVCAKGRCWRHDRMGARRRRSEPTAPDRCRADAGVYAASSENAASEPQMAEGDISSAEELGGLVQHAAGRHPIA